MQEYVYTVAGHRFSILVEANFAFRGALAHYAPFASNPDTASPAVFRLHVVPESDLLVPDGLTEEFNQDDEGSQIRILHAPDGASWFEFRLWDQLAGRMLAREDFREAWLSPLSHPAFALDNALMLLYALSTASLQTALFHAAVIGCEGRGYLFLGKSGTGKSTHARLWLKYIPGSKLLNDDNPVVRIEADGSVRVYGSPWSGKTPCYKNESLAAGGFVQLAQAPYNAIRRVRPIEAYASLLSSISGKRWDRLIANGLHDTENALISRIPFWHLDCLPDEEAARLCHQTITGA